MFNYPIDYTLYSTEEIVEIIEFLSMIEDANNKNVDAKVLLGKYRNYTNIINAKSTLKKIDSDFLKVSGYSIYKTINKYKTKK